MGPFGFHDERGGVMGMKRELRLWRKQRGRRKERGRKEREGDEIVRKKVGKQKGGERDIERRNKKDLEM